MQLNDPSLFNQQAYINGTWVEAHNNDVIQVTNPADNTLVAPYLIWVKLRLVKRLMLLMQLCLNGVIKLLQNVLKSCVGGLI